MKIILRQFLIVDNETKQETRTSRTFNEVIKRYRNSTLYLEQCTTIPQKGWDYNKTYKRAYVGEISRKLSVNNYINAKQRINQP